MQEQLEVLNNKHRLQEDLTHLQVDRNGPIKAIRDHLAHNISEQNAQVEKTKQNVSNNIQS